MKRRNVDQQRVREALAVAPAHAAHARTKDRARAGRTAQAHIQKTLCTLHFLRRRRAPAADAGWLLAAACMASDELGCLVLVLPHGRREACAGARVRMCARIMLHGCKPVCPAPSDAMRPNHNHESRLFTRTAAIGGSTPCISVTGRAVITRKRACEQACRYAPVRSSAHAESAHARSVSKFVFFFFTLSACCCCCRWSHYDSRSRRSILQALEQPSVTPLPPLKICARLRTEQINKVIRYHSLALLLAMRRGCRCCSPTKN